MMSISYTGVCCTMKLSGRNLRNCALLRPSRCRSHSTVAGVENANRDIPSGDLEDGPLRLYEHRLMNGELRSDENQRVVIEHLHQLSRELEKYMNSRTFNNGIIDDFTAKLKGWFNMSSGAHSKKEEAKKLTHSPKGIYLFGGVGCGKTMLMDLFHDACTISHKKRVHFHAFMLDVHKRIHRVKMSMGSKNFNLNREQPYDPILPVAREISTEASLLCFDELQVTDIGDAMILKRLFSHMWQNGVVVVATSNRRPDDLYKNGLQRNNFLPFIPMLKMNCDVVNLNSIDYRRQSAPVEGNTFFAADRCDAKYEMDRIYEELISRDTGTEGTRHLEVYGRTLSFEKTCGRILDVTFAELCTKPLGAVDYLEICNNFDIVLLRDVPQLSLGHRSETRRFITLIDTLYDQRVRVIFSAATVPEDLFIAEDTSEYDKHHARVLMGDLNIQEDDGNKASLFTGEEEAFAFERAISRIVDMRSASYWSHAAELHANKHT